MKIRRSSYFLNKYALILALLIGCDNPCFSQIGRSLHFDGVNDYVDISKPLFDINNGNTPYTIESWIKTPQSQDDCIVCQYSFPGDYRFQFEMRNDKLNWWKASGTSVLVSVLSSQSVADGNWHHVAGTIDSNGSVKLYIDGNLDGSGIDTFKYMNTNTTIGYRPNSGFFEGNMDEVRIWRTTRSAAQIQANMCPDTQFDTTGLIAYYKFNQGLASGNNTSITTLTDETNNMNHGTLNQFGLTGSTSNWVDITPCWPVGVSDMNNELEVKLYPNPANQIINISLPDNLNKAKVSIFDLSGKSVHESDLRENKNVLRLDGLDSGMYFIRLEINGYSKIYKIVVRNDG